MHPLQTDESTFDRTRKSHFLKGIQYDSKFFFRKESNLGLLNTLKTMQIIIFGSDENLTVKITAEIRVLSESERNPQLETGHQ